MAKSAPLVRNNAATATLARRFCAVTPTWSSRLSAMGTDVTDDPHQGGGSAWHAEAMRTEAAAEDLLGLFPPGSKTDGDGTLVVGGCRLDDVAAEFGTPAIVVAEDALRNRAREYLDAFRSRWPRSDLAFASKSFPCTAVQRVMVDEGLHLDVAGGGEILTAIKAGADPARLVLHGNAKTDEELELAVKHGLGLVVVDNFDDIDRLERIVPQGHRQRCLVRVIPGVEAATHASQATGHAGSKFGLMPDDAREAIARIERSPVLQLDGVHTHVGSQLLNVDQLAAAVEPIAEARHVRHLRPRRRPRRALHLRRAPAHRRRLRRRDGRRRPARCCPTAAASSSSRAAAWSRQAPARYTASRRSSAASLPTSRSTAAWATTSRCR